MEYDQRICLVCENTMSDKSSDWAYRDKDKEDDSLIGIHGSCSLKRFNNLIKNT